MKARRTALVVCGLLLMLFGAASATYVGPDDTVIIGSHTVGQPASGQAVRTHPAITDFVNINLLVRAEAPGGVFLGYAHRVDTTNLLEGRRHWTITRMSLGNVGGSMTEGGKSSSTRALRPERIVGWLDSTSGDSVELSVPLEGEPIDVVAVPSAGDERVRISLGAQVDNLFLSQLGVIGVGGVLIGLSFLLGWWVRRKDERGAHRSTSVDGALTLPKMSDGPGEHVRQESRSDSLAAPVAAPVVAPVAAPVIAPGPPPPRVTPLTPPAPVAAPAAPAGATAVVEPRRFQPRFLLLLAVFPLARIVRRRFFLSLVVLVLALATQACGVPGPAASNDGSLSRTGLSLAEAGQLVDDPVDVYAREFTTYPMWAMIATADPNRIQLRTRTRFTAKWRSRGTVRLAKKSEMPASVSSAIDPGRVLQERADSVAMQVGSWWSTGEADGVGIDGRTKKARRALLESGVSAGGIATSPAADAPLVRMVEVSGGHLLWITHTVSTPLARYRLLTVAMMETTSTPQVLGSRLAEAPQQD